MPKRTQTEVVVIIDFGSQYTQLIARRVREIGVYCEIFPYDCDVTQFVQANPKGIILSGGPESVTTSAAPRVPAEIFSLNCPILAICYGMQAMSVQLGGEVQAASEKEFGYASLELHGHSTLFERIEDKTSVSGSSLLDVWMSHGDKVTVLPPGFECIATTESSPFAAIANKQKHWYGLQFHPEVTHTMQGQRIIKRFLLDICHCAAQWTLQNIVDTAIEQVRTQVGQEIVILGLSGGVDSSVVAALLQRAIGKQLICIFVDTGLLRHDEPQRVMKLFAEHLGVTVYQVQAEQRFLAALAGVTDPEAKRKVIGELFIKIFEEQASQHHEAKWLAQGTIYSDVIESAGNNAAKGHLIKSHHNVGGLPADMQLSLLEPIRNLFKDEVRKIGLELGLPYEMLYCHPFPGPGLGVRILGEIKQQYVSILRQADHVFIEELKKYDLYDKVSQAFVVFLPVKSVAVKGDARAYDYVLTLRAVKTEDFMTANWAKLPYDFLEAVSRRILNEVPNVSRLTYDISGKPPATIEWE